MLPLGNTVIPGLKNLRSHSNVLSKTVVYFMSSAKETESVSANAEDQMTLFSTCSEMRAL